MIDHTTHPNRKQNARKSRREDSKRSRQSGIVNLRTITSVPITSLLLCVIIPLVAVQFGFRSPSLTDTRHEMHKAQSAYTDTILASTSSTPQSLAHSSVAAAILSHVETTLSQLSLLASSTQHFLQESPVLLDHEPYIHSVGTWLYGAAGGSVLPIRSTVYTHDQGDTQYAEFQSTVGSGRLVKSGRCSSQPKTQQLVGSRLINAQPGGSPPLHCNSPFKNIPTTTEGWYGPWLPTVDTPSTSYLSQVLELEQGQHQSMGWLRVDVDTVQLSKWLRRLVDNSQHNVLRLLLLLNKPQKHFNTDQNNTIVGSSHGELVQQYGPDSGVTQIATIDDDLIQRAVIDQSPMFQKSNSEVSRDKYQYITNVSTKEYTGLCTVAINRIVTSQNIRDGMLSAMNNNTGDNSNTQQAWWLVVIQENRDTPNPSTTTNNIKHQADASSASKQNDNTINTNPHPQSKTSNDESNRDTTTITNNTHFTLDDVIQYNVNLLAAELRVVTSQDLEVFLISIIIMCVILLINNIVLIIVLNDVVSALNKVNGHMHKFYKSWFGSVSTTNNTAYRPTTHPSTISKFTEVRKLDYVCRKLVAHFHHIRPFLPPTVFTGQTNTNNETGSVEIPTDNSSCSMLVFDDIIPSSPGSPASPSSSSSPTSASSRGFPQPPFRQINPQVFGQPELSKRTGSLMAIDFQGFHNLFGVLQLPEITVIYENYIKTVLHTLWPLHAATDHFVGDKLMASWNVATEVTDHCHVACVAALTVVRNLHDANKNHTTKHPINASIGVVCGTVFAGWMGCDWMRGYTQISRRIKTAYMLTHLNRELGTSILVDEAVYTNASTSCKFRPICTLDVHKATAVLPNTPALPGLKTASCSHNSNSNVVYELLCCKGPTIHHSAVASLGSSTAYSTAYDAYYSGQLVAAERNLLKHLEEFPTDKPGQMFLERVKKTKKGVTLSPQLTPQLWPHSPALHSFNSQKGFTSIDTRQQQLQLSTTGGLGIPLSNTALEELKKVANLQKYYNHDNCQFHDDCDYTTTTDADATMLFNSSFSFPMVTNQHTGDSTHAPPATNGDPQMDGSGVMSSDVMWGLAVGGGGGGGGGGGACGGELVELPTTSLLYRKKKIRKRSLPGKSTPVKVPPSCPLTTGTGKGAGDSSLNEQMQHKESSSSNDNDHISIDVCATDLATIALVDRQRSVDNTGA